MVSLPRQDDILAGKYRVEQVIGRGGMGVVMAAWHLELDQRVALKFLLPEFAEHNEAAERFRREARSSAKIRSEHVVRVLDVGSLEGGEPFMVMEYLDGRDLGVEHRERGPLPVQECIDYVLQAIEAVAEAHALGIIHRDLKPENLFLARRPDGTRCIKVLDFGISKNTLLSSQRALTNTAVIMGSPFYMSPEQMRAPRSVDNRSDIWSIGAILYDLLAGRPPYVADTIPQLCTMVLEGDPPPLRDLRPEIHRDLERVVTRCLVRAVAERWTSVGELAIALLPFASRSSRIHVERAGRMLSPSDLASLSLPPPPESEAAHAVRSTAESPSWNPGIRGSAPEAVRAGATPTQESWETRRRSGAPAAKSGLSAPRWILFGLLGAVSLLGVGAWVFTSASSAGQPGAAVSAPILVSPPAPSSLDDTPAQAPTQSAEMAAPGSTPAAAVESPTAPAPAGASVTTVAPKPPTLAADKTAKPSDSPSTDTRAAKTPPPRPASSSPTGLTDFGGRN